MKAPEKIYVEVCEDEIFAFREPPFEESRREYVRKEKAMPNSTEVRLMTDEQIVEAAKIAEQQTKFGELVHSKVARGIHSAFGIGFIEGAVWMREQYGTN